MLFKLSFICLFTFVSFTCTHDKTATEVYNNHKVILVVIDGPRYSETWGESTKQYIPKQVELATKGIIFSNFRNEGITFTNPGHQALLSGYYENIANNSTVIPEHKNFWQYFLEQTNCADAKVALIASKDKLEALVKNNLSVKKPYTDCGNNGLGSGYRNDSITHQHILSYLENDKPDLLFINYMGPDVYGHANDWNGYLAAIQQTDQYVHDLWNLIENNPYYSGKTTFIVTNDHGRHLNGHLDGFVSHGDDCEGCRHISLLLISPNLSKGITLNGEYDMGDLSPFIAKITGMTGYKSYKQSRLSQDLLK